MPVPLAPVAYSADVQGAGFQLGVDFGTSHTVAVLRWPDGRAKPLLFDGSPLLPSAVYLDATGQLLVGRDALDSARLEPSRLEPNPKRRIDEGSVLLGDHALPVADVIAAVLGVVRTEAIRTAGKRPAVVTLTCPAAWGAPRRRVLLDAAVRAGLGDVRMVEEPVAAATYFAQVLGYRMPIGCRRFALCPSRMRQPARPASRNIANGTSCLRSE